MLEKVNKILVDADTCISYLAIGPPGMWILQRRPSVNMLNVLNIKALRSGATSFTQLELSSLVTLGTCIIRIEPGVQICYVLVVCTL